MTSKHFRLLTIPITLSVVMISLLATLAAQTTPAQARASILYVAPDGNCGAQTPCYASVQAAVDAANHGDEIRLAAGTYTGVSPHPAPAGYDGSSIITQTLYLSKTLTLRGGYTTSDWATSDPDTNPTILDAQGQGRVLFIAGETNPLVEGVQLTGGNASGLAGNGSSDAGGGVYILAASATISNNLVLSNTAAHGGGLYLSGSSATVSGNTVVSNTAAYGGGLFLSGSSATVSNNTISSNTVTVSGGGLYLYSTSSATLSDNTISGNTAIRGKGGGLLLNGSSPTLNNNTISDNTSSHGGGLYVHYCSPLLNGNTISNNSATHGGGLFLFISTITMVNNVMTGNQTTDFGGALYLYRSILALNGNRLSHNTASSGGALYLDGESHATFLNNIVTDNSATSQGSGLYLAGHVPQLLHTTIARNTGGDGSGIYLTGNASQVKLTNTILVSQTVGIYATEGHTATVSGVLWSDNGTNTAGDGTIHVTNEHTGDPAFASDGYHLTAGSAAVDRAVPLRDPFDYMLDIDNDYRRLDGSSLDLGADELLTTSAQCAARLNGGGSVYSTVQEAINASTAENDVVEVAGVCEQAESSHSTASLVVLTRTLTLRGGYSLDFSTWDPQAHPTVLNGRLRSRVLEIDAGANPTVEYLTLLGGQASSGGGLWSASTMSDLRHLRIANNLATYGGGVYFSRSTGVLEESLIGANWSRYGGGGVYLANSTDMTLNNNTISGNTAVRGSGGGLILGASSSTLNNNTISQNMTLWRAGGGLHLNHSSPLLSGNTISNNWSAHHGGGLFLAYSSPTLQHNTVSHNTAKGYGGGLYLGSYQNRNHSMLLGNLFSSNHAASSGGGLFLNGGVPLLQNNIVISNTADSGAGISLSGGYPTLINNVVADNNASTQGSGLYVTQSTPQLLHTTIARNTGGDGSGIYLASSSDTVALTNMIFVSQTVGIHITEGYTATLNGVLWFDNGTNTVGDGTIHVANQYTGDPLFAADGYHLTAGSAAVNRAIPRSEPLDYMLDIDHDFRRLDGPLLDLGADELLSTEPECRARLNGDGLIYNTIQEAIDASTAESDVVEVAGVCEQTAKMDSTAMVVLTKTLTLRGGYSLDFSSWEPDTYLTVLNARLQNRVMSIEGVSPLVEHLTLVGGFTSYGGGIRSTNASPVLQHLRVANNIASGSGGGLYLYRSGAALSNNTVSNNRAGSNGAGVFMHESSPTLNSNLISHNLGSRGGGVYLSHSYPLLKENTISHNLALSAGGGLYLSYSSPTLQHNTVSHNTTMGSGGGLVLGSYQNRNHSMLLGNLFSSNHAASSGGGLFLNGGVPLLQNNIVISNTADSGAGISLSGGYPTLINNVIADNSASTQGSGLYVTQSTPQLLHTTLARNTGGDGSGIYLASSSDTVALTNTILVSQTVGLHVTEGYTATFNGVLWFDNGANTGGDGTINVTNEYTGDPLFAADGYHLTGGSAAIDRGVDAGVETDIDQESRPLGVMPELGADEYEAVSLSISKIGPATAIANELITYTLTLTNSGNVPATNVLITDRLPIGATYVSGGTLDGDVVGWNVPQVAAQSSTTVQLVVTATQPITNSEYGVLADGGYSATGSEGVVTQIHPLLGIYALAFDGQPNSAEDLSELFEPTMDAIVEATSGDANKTAIVLIDQHGAHDTRLYVVQNDQVLLESGLPDLAQDEIFINPALDEYDMTDGVSLGAFLRWALEQYATPATKVSFTYVSHGTFLAPAVDLETLSAAATPTRLGQEGRGAGDSSFFPLPTELYVKTGLSDNNPKESVITPHALQVALQIGTDEGTNPLDVLDIVHCFSGSIEEFYELSNAGSTPYATTMIGSANYSYFGPTMLGRALGALDSHDDPAGLATSIMAAYDEVLEEADLSDGEQDVEHPRTIVVVESSKLPPIKQEMDVLSSFLMSYFDNQPTETKNKLVDAYQNAAHYDTTTCPPRDWQLTAPDALVDIGVFMEQIADVNISPEVTTHAQQVVGAVNGGAIITHTARSGVPWFSDSAEAWALEDLSGLALYADFEGTGNDHERVLSWHSTFYTDSQQIEFDNGIIIANEHPYLFIQNGNGEETWADVFNKLWQVKEQDEGITIQTSLCLPDFPPPLQEGELSVERITFPLQNNNTVYLNHPTILAAAIHTEQEANNALVRFEVYDASNSLVFSNTVGTGYLQADESLNIQATDPWTPTIAGNLRLEVTVDPDNRFLEPNEENTATRNINSSSNTPFEMSAKSLNEQQWFTRTVTLELNSSINPSDEPEGLDKVIVHLLTYRESESDPNKQVPYPYRQEHIQDFSAWPTISFDLPNEGGFPPGPIVLHVWGEDNNDIESQSISVIPINYAPRNRFLGSNVTYFTFNATGDENIEINLNVTAGEANLYIWQPGNRWSAEKLADVSGNTGTIRFGEGGHYQTRHGKYTVMIEGLANDTRYTISSLHDGQPGRALSTHATSNPPITVQLARPTFIEPIPEIPPQIPAAVQLAAFEADSTSDHIAVTWQTVAELDNLGFNLYRSTDETTVGERLNGSLIPSQAPGSGSGASYEWLDHDVEPETTYYYWLEDVETSGTTTLHGPVSATANIPLAITLDTLHAATPSHHLLIISGLLLALMSIALVVRALARKGLMR